MTPDPRKVAEGKWIRIVDPEFEYTERLPGEVE